MSRVDAKLYFSPKFTFGELDFKKPAETILAFRDRVYGFYIGPAQELATKAHAFACGVICCSTIDFLAQYSGVRGKDRFEAWLGQNVRDFGAPDSRRHSSTLAKRFYEDFRCGLLHNGRIKSLGQFSLDQNSLITFDAEALIVNPSLLLDAIEIAFERYCMTLQTEGAAQALLAMLQSDFREEIDATRGTRSHQAWERSSVADCSRSRSSICTMSIPRPG